MPFATTAKPFFFVTEDAYPSFVAIATVRVISARVGIRVPGGLLCRVCVHMTLGWETACCVPSNSCGLIVPRGWRFHLAGGIAELWVLVGGLYGHGWGGPRRNGHLRLNYLLWSLGLLGRY